jgi:hypothetical protein
MRRAPPAPGVEFPSEPATSGQLTNGLYDRLTDHFRERSVPLLISLLILLATAAWFDEHFGGLPIFALLLTLVLLSSIFRLSTTRRQAMVGALLGTPTIVVLWLAEFLPNLALSQAALGLLTLFFLYTTATILLYVLREETVTMETLEAAFSVFLLMGFAWGSIYGLIYLQDPSAFRLPDPVPAAQGSGITANAPLDVLIYFSFVTLTTVGYGDVLAATGSSRAMAILEAVVGHFYLAILIGRLVGLSIAYAERRQ